MGHINMELPDDVHKEAKKAAIDHDMTLREYVIYSLSETTGLNAEDGDEPE